MAIRLRLSDSAKDDGLMRDLPATMTPFHWHGDNFRFAAGAVSLASSEKTPCRHFATRQGTDYQFHFEVTQEGVASMRTHSRKISARKYSG